MTDKSNISTENRPKGAARKPSDTLDQPANSTGAGNPNDAPDRDDEPDFVPNGD